MVNSKTNLLSDSTFPHEEKFLKVLQNPESGSLSFFFPLSPF